MSLLSNCSFQKPFSPRNIRTFVIFCGKKMCVHTRSYRKRHCLHERSLVWNKNVSQYRSVPQIGPPPPPPHTFCTKAKIAKWGTYLRDTIVCECYRKWHRTRHTVPIIKTIYNAYCTVDLNLVILSISTSIMFTLHAIV